MRIKRITHITSFSSTGEMYHAIKAVSHELGIDASELIRRALEYYFAKQNLCSKEKQYAESDLEEDYKNE